MHKNDQLATFDLLSYLGHAVRDFLDVADAAFDVLLMLGLVLDD